FLIGDVRFHGIRDQKIRTAPRGLRQLRQAFLGFRLQPDAKGCTPCVCHEHILAQRAAEPIEPARCEYWRTPELIMPGNTYLIPREFRCSEYILSVCLM